MQINEIFTYYCPQIQKYISGNVIEAKEDSYVLCLIGDPRVEVPKSFFSGMNRVHRDEIDNLHTIETKYGEKSRQIFNVAMAEDNYGNI